MFFSARHTRRVGRWVEGKLNIFIRTRPHQIPKQCSSENERYKTCGTTCVETCDKEPALCTDECVAGCFCSYLEYVRQNNNANLPRIHSDECAEDD